MQPPDPLTAELPRDFWRINSYSYPNPFGGALAVQAYETAFSFLETRDYQALKRWWEGPEAPRMLKPHAVESWKAALEEFGLVYVVSGSGRITATPASATWREAAEARDEPAFAWAGLNLLLRYPLRGPRGAAHSERMDGSDLLLYRAFWTMLLELDGYLWYPEMVRVLMRVFRNADVDGAVRTVRALREAPRRILEIDLPADRERGQLYNSANQIANHAGLNRLLLEHDTNAGCPYPPHQTGTRYRLRPAYRRLVEDALQGPAAGCALAARLPGARRFEREEDYFAYAGAPIPPRGRGPRLLALEQGGEHVALLREGVDYTGASTTAVEGPARSLCQLGVGQRVILLGDLADTWIVQAKQAMQADAVRLQVRRARPITDPAPILRRVAEDEDGNG